MNMHCLSVLLPPPSLAPSLSQGIFLVYDISSERSYQHIMKWVSDVDEVGDATSLPGVGKGHLRGEGKVRARWDGLKLLGLAGKHYQDNLASTALDEDLWVSKTWGASPSSMPSVLCSLQAYGCFFPGRELRLKPTLSPASFLKSQDLVAL